MSLSDRLAQRMTTAVAPAEKPTGAHRLTTEAPPPPGRQGDPFAAVNRHVHAGPRAPPRPTPHHLPAAPRQT